MRAPFREKAATFAALALLAGCRDRSPAERTPPAPPRPRPASSAAARAAAPGSVHLAFRAHDPHAYCRNDDCSGAPPVTIRRAGGADPLLLHPGPCPTSCSDCRAPSGCLAAVCTPAAVAVPGAELAWDGTYYEPSTCGGGTPCVAARRAEPGRYVAELCALPGDRTIDSIGAPQCIAGGARRCGALEFDFPPRSAETLMTTF